MSARLAVAYVRVLDCEPELPQRVAIETWAARSRVAIASWQIDRGVEGTTPIAERPGLVAAYRALREHHANILVAADARRFAHDELVAWLIERAALTEGATIEVASSTRAEIALSPPKPEPAQSYTRGTIDLARAYHRAMLRAKMRTVFAAKRARGERVGTVPYGYRLTNDGVHIESDETEQGVILSVRNLSREGFSQRAIVARLAEGGVKGRTGAPLGQTQVAKILKGA